MGSALRLGTVSEVEVTESISARNRMPYRWYLTRRESMNKKIVLPLAALATSIILTACGTSAPAPASTHTAAAATSAATASHAPTPAFAASPTGIWNIAYTSAPASILGQYTITENGGFYDMTTKTVLKM